MSYRLVVVSGKFGGNRRLPTGKVNPGRDRVANHPGGEHDWRGLAGD